MTSTLYGSRYIGDADPGAVGAGFEWADTTSGDLKVRNTSNSSWVTVGNINNTNLGLLALAGGAMTGSITGAHALAPVNSPNFTGTPQKSGANLATETYVDAVETDLLSTIGDKVSEAIANITSNFSVNANLAIGMGVLLSDSGNSFRITVPLPTYPGGASAAESECKWIAFPVAFDMGYTTYWTTSDAAGTTYVDPSTVRTFYAQMMSSPGVPSGVENRWGYIIIASK